MKFKLRTVVGFVGILGLFACDGGQPTDLSPSHTSNSNQPVAHTVERFDPAIDALTRALAAALRDASVRDQLLQAFRASPWNERKLVLQEYVRTGTGRDLLNIAAANTTSTVGEIVSLLASVPDMDFYMPFDEHRESWAGTADLAVIGTLDPDEGALFGYHLDGSPFEFVRRSGTPTTAVVAIHGAEPKQRRSEEPFAQLTTSNCPDEPSTCLDYIRIFFDDGFGDVELEVRARFYDPRQTYIDADTYSNAAFDPYGEDNPGYLFFPQVTPDSSPAYVAIEIWEVGWDGSEFYGFRNFYWDDMGSNKAIYDNNGNHQATVRLKWPPRSPQQIATLSVQDVSVEMDSTTGMSVWATDQYGYGVPFTHSYGAAVSADLISASSSDTDVATVEGIDDFRPRGVVTVKGWLAGSATVSVTVRLRGVKTNGSGSVTVNVPDPGLPPQQ